MFARVATFEGDQDQVRKLAQEIGSDSEPPEGIPAKELMLLTGLDSGKLTAIVFFETEDDLRRGHATLNEMSPDDASVKRSGVELYEVAARRTV
jgi:hypothetical protein